MIVEVALSIMVFILFLTSFTLALFLNEYVTKYRIEKIWSSYYRKWEAKWRATAMEMAGIQEGSPARLNERRTAPGEEI